MRTLAMLTCLLAVLPLTGCAADRSGRDHYEFSGATALGTSIPSADRRPARDLAGELLDGRPYDIADLSGKTVVINFWATWCPPCVVEAPQLDAISRTYAGKPVTFLGIDTKESSRDAPRAFVKDNAISYPIAWDEDSRAASVVGGIPAAGLPFTVLLDRHHRVAAVYLRPLTAPDLTPALDRLLAEA